MTSTSASTPTYVYLRSPADPLPSSDYIRVIALSNATCDTNALPLSRYTVVEQPPTRGGEGGAKGGNKRSECIVEEGAVRHDFALHVRGARFCRLLGSMLDEADLDISTTSPSQSAGSKNVSQDKELSVTLPCATRGSCERVFRYLDLITTRMPTLVSKPLRAPLEELVQPWEMKFLMEDCILSYIRATESKGGAGRYDAGASDPHDNMDADADQQSSPTQQRWSTSYSSNAPNGGRVFSSESLNMLMEVMLLSDYLIVAPLRDLVCSMMASIALSCSTDSELLKLCGRSKPLDEQELQAVYAEYPFLKTLEE